MSHIVTWEEPEPHLELARASNRLYQTLGDELAADLEYRRTGSIAIVEKAESLPGMAAMVGRLQAWGLDCRLLSREELLAMEPNLAPDVAGGAYFPTDAQVNPLYTTRALARARGGAGRIGRAVHRGDGHRAGWRGACDGRPHRRAAGSPRGPS